MTSIPKVCLPYNRHYANALAVSIGEPVAVSDPTTHYMLETATDTTRLPLTVTQPVPVWAADIDTMFMNAACLEVLEDGAQTTATLVCEPVSDFDTQGNPPMTHAGFTGIRLAKSTLTDILGLPLGACPGSSPTKDS